MPSRGSRAIPKSLSRRSNWRREIPASISKRVRLVSSSAALPELPDASIEMRTEIDALPSADFRWNHGKARVRRQRPVYVW